MLPPGISHFSPGPEAMQQGSTYGPAKSVGTGNKNQSGKQMSIIKVGDSVPKKSCGTEGTSDVERLKIYRKWYHELDQRRSELNLDSEENLTALRLIEAEIRCLEELIVLSTKLGNMSLNDVGMEQGRVSQQKFHPIPGYKKSGGGVEDWPSDSSIPSVEGLDLSLITDMLMLSATSPWTVYVAERVQWTLCYVSPSAKPILGWKQSEVIGSTAWDGCHPDDVRNVQKMLGDVHDVAAHGGSHHSPPIVCFRRLRRDRSYATVQATGRPLGARWYAWVELLVAQENDDALPPGEGTPSPEASWTQPPPREPLLALSQAPHPHQKPPPPPQQQQQQPLPHPPSAPSPPLKERHLDPSDAPPQHRYLNPRKNLLTTLPQSVSLHRGTTSSSSAGGGGSGGGGGEGGGRSGRSSRVSPGGGAYSTLPYGAEFMSMAALQQHMEGGRGLPGMTAGPPGGEAGVGRKEGRLSNLSINVGANGFDRSLNDSLDSNEAMEASIWRDEAPPHQQQPPANNHRSGGGGGGGGNPGADGPPNYAAPPQPPPQRPSAGPASQVPLGVARRRQGQLAGSSGGGRSALRNLAMYSGLTADDLNLIRGQKVLLVEDDVVNRTVGQRVLESLECEVTVTCNGAEALAVMQGSLGEDDGGSGGSDALGYNRNNLTAEGELPPQFDLVLMDLIMPVMDGLRAVEQFRTWEELQEPRRKRMLIFAVTSNVTDGDMVKCAQSGFDEFVSKPLTLDKLIHRLQGVLRQRNGGKARTLDGSF